mmetsp:Transcript_334/g.618  ORF Transcript_334/g.618 Transcript_334/m.618 type:complete len:893 (+) Transcript_334:113-2791(+)
MAKISESVNVRLIPLLGGREYGAVSSILEIGYRRFLLDCGCLPSTDVATIESIRKYLTQSPPLDGILLSHADLDHIGGLPYLFGTNGIKNVPVICTLPVLKMGHMVLYDLYCNREYEGWDDSASPRFTLDDVDCALSMTQTVKFNQSIDLCAAGGSAADTSLCAYPAGRTIGGSCWRIRHGTTEVVYVMDMHLRKSAVVDGGVLSLPSSPSLMIVEGGCASPERNVSGGLVTGRRRKGIVDEGVIAAVMETVRMEGNVLIPCETAGRTLDMIYSIGKHWAENKYSGLYHLVYLSPMGNNVMEFARSQLEWMSDSLSKGFYLGKANPFAMPHMSVCTNLKELQRLGPGPKVVLVTDISLSLGMSKELLLRWGGDPRCRVIFTDQPQHGTLAAEIRLLSHSPPIIATVDRPERVLLEGEELSSYMAKQVEGARREDEAEHRRMRERELAQLIGGTTVTEEVDGSDQSGDDEEPDVTEIKSDSDAVTLATPTKRSLSVESSNFNSGFKRARISNGASNSSSIGRISQYAKPRFNMFETKEIEPTVDDYGAANTDLKFTSVVTSSILVPRQGGSLQLPSSSLHIQQNSGDVPNRGQGSDISPVLPLTPSMDRIADERVDSSLNEDQQPPFKIISKKVKIQFTCGFKELPSNTWGRSDFKGVKTIISTCGPRRVVVLRGTGHDCDAVVQYSRRSSKADAFAPSNFEAVEFSVKPDRIRVMMSHSHLNPNDTRVINGNNRGHDSGSHVVKTCSVSTVKGILGDVCSSQVATAYAADSNGIQVVHLKEKSDSNVDPAVQLHLSLPHSLICEKLQNRFTNLPVTVGAISVGEVLLNTLQLDLTSSGVIVESKLGFGGAMLVCAGQVTVRKENENDFIVEGPPCTTFFQVRDAVYKQFAFI